MLDDLRKPFLVIALVLMGLVVLVEGTSVFWINADEVGSSLGAKAPGYGINYLAFLDYLVFYVTLWMGLEMLTPKIARFQGCVTAIVTFLGCLGTIAAIITCLISLIIMVTLLLAPIFGTLAYVAIYGDFERGDAAKTLSLIMALKIGFVVCLLLAHQRFLQNKGLVVITLLSFLCSIIISFLHNFVPLLLVSITDALGAIIVGIIALIWTIIIFVFAVISLIKWLKPG